MSQCGVCVCAHTCTRACVCVCVMHVLCTCVCALLWAGMFAIVHLWKSEDNFQDQVYPSTLWGRVSSSCFRCCALYSRISQFCLPSDHQNTKITDMHLHTHGSDCQAYVANVFTHWAICQVFTVILTFISLATGDVEHFFIYIRHLSIKQEQLGVELSREIIEMLPLDPCNKLQQC